MTENGEPKLPIAGSRENFELLLAKGMPPDKLVLATFQALRNTVSDLMHAIPKERVSESNRLQVMALAMAIDNACSAMETELVVLPVDIEKGLEALGEALEDIVRGQGARTREGQEGPGEQPEDK